MVVKVFGRYGKTVEITDWFCIARPGGRPIFPEGDPLDIFHVPIISLFNQSYQIQKSVFSFTQNDEIYLIEIIKKVVPQKGGPHTAKYDLDTGIDLLRNSRNLYGTPPVCMKH